MTSSIFTDLAQTPRLLKLLSFDGDNLLVQRSIPVRRGTRLAPSVAMYRRTSADSWREQWYAPTVFAVSACDQVLYGARAGESYEIRARDFSGIDVTWKQLSGRPIAGVWHGQSRTLAVIVEQSRSRTAPDQSAPGPICVRDHVASLADIRRGGVVRNLVLARPSEEVATVDVTAVLAGGALTGEIACCLDGTIVVGTSHDQPDGARWFGLALVDPILGIEHQILDPDFDLSGPVAASTIASGVACVAISRPSADVPLGQAAAVISVAPSGWTRRLLADGWVTPKAWLSPEELLCIVDSPCERSLSAFRLSDGQSRVLLGDTRDVSGVQAYDDRVAVLTSTPFDEPRVQVVDLRHDDRYVHVAGPDPTGREHDVSFLPTTFGDSDETVGGIWLCQSPAQRRRGMLAIFHGGPIKRWGDWSWRWNPYPFLNEGYRIALIDAPMSVGYGTMSMALGWRQWRTGLAEVAVAQVQQARAACGALSEPVAVMGGSFGGYLAIASARPVQASVVVAHGPPLELGRVAAGGDAAWQWLREYGDPDLNRELYREQSVTIDDVPGSARVLLSHGLADDLVPVHDSVALHRGLVRRGVRSELMLFPDEGHAVLSPRNVQCWSTAVLRIVDEAVAAETANG